MKKNHTLFRNSFGISLIILLAIVLHGCSGADDEEEPTGGGGGGGGPSLTSSYNDCISDNATAAYVGENSATADPLAGGLLYDKWWTALNESTAPTAISDDHPAWQNKNTNANTASGSSTWRCKECHGWDYKGKDGAYGTGSHYTGFPGLVETTTNADAAWTDSPLSVFCSIKSGTVAMPEHQFNASNTGDVLTDEAIMDLTAFITNSKYLNTQTANIDTTTFEGLVDTDDVINGDNNSASYKSIINGDTTTGQSVYTTSGCSLGGCHGSEGTVNAGDHGSIGDLAASNPWETMHKTRFGHPGSVMWRSINNPLLTIGEIRDVLAYTQTLATSGGDTGGGTGGGGTGGGDTGGGTGGGDTGGGDTNTTPVSDAEKMARGGLLYDNWPAELGIVPNGDNPLWAKQTTNNRSGVDTWRCKECHGWDYKGREGAYGDGSTHYTGFNGLLQIAVNPNRDESAVSNFITDGFIDRDTGQRLHNYGQLYLTESEVQALTYFIKNGGVFDTSAYIIESPATLRGSAKGNSTNGAILFSRSNSCGSSACHGADGRSPVNSVAIDLPALSWDNPWEVLHKARFGQPDSIMPSMVEKGLTTSESADVLSHIQTIQ